MSAQPPSNPNPLDELRSGLKESPPLDEFKAGIADKQPLVQGNQPRYAFGWFDKWLLIIPVILLLVCLLLGWFALEPSAPPSDSVTLNTPSSGTTTTVGQPIEVSGTAPPNSQVELYNHDKLVATTQADADGNFQFNLLPTQSGDYELKTVTTVNGQRVESAVVAITVSGAVAANPTTTAPSQGAQTEIATGAPATAQNAASAQTQTASNANNAQTPTLVASTADANTAATLDAVTTQSAQATASASETPVSANAIVPTAIQATAQAPSATTESTPAAVTLTPGSSETGTALLNPPTVNVPASSVVVAGSPLAGTAPPNSHVIIYFGDVEIAQTDADANGNWQLTVPNTVTSGEYEIRIAAVNANGQVISTSQPTAITIVAQQVTATPEIQATGIAKLNPPTMNIAANGIILPGEALTGSAPPNSRVVIFFNDAEIGRVDTDANGIWVLVVPNTLAPGTYNVRAAVVDANGKIVVSAPQEIAITVASKPLLPVTGGKWWRAPRHCR